MGGLGGIRGRSVVWLAALAASTAFGAPVASGATDLLPDLDPRLDKPRLTWDSGRVYLTFTATVDNVGEGVLNLSGHRADVAEESMVADQVVEQSDGTVRTIPGVGAFAYDDGYARWGLEEYLSYTLRKAKKRKKIVSRGPELGFCVVDWEDADPDVALPGEPADPVHTSCGSEEPELLTITQGISVGWANVHAAWRKGQLVDITSVRAGTYLLVQRVNQGKDLLESDYRNNAASVLIRIKRPKGMSGQPKVKTLRICQDTAVCKKRR